MTAQSQSITPAEAIETRIRLFRGHKVMLDADLASLYQVTTKRLNEQVRRNRDRFPEDFMFQLTVDEVNSLRSHIATSNMGRGGRRTLPYAFTEHGAVMLASVLNSPVAVEASIQVVRAFVRLREILATHKELANKLVELEARIEAHDKGITALFEAIRQLMEPPDTPQRRIGFRSAKAT